MLHERKSLSERLRFALKVLGISQTELARRIHVKPQVIQYLCSGNSSKTKFMFDIAEALKIDVSWLAIGKGEPPSNSNIVNHDKTIPILSFSQIKESKVLLKEIDFSKSSRIPILNDINIKSFAFTLNDSSMAPRFNLDTIVIIDPTIDIHQINKKDRFVLVYLERDDCLLFRHLNVTNDNKILVSFNSNIYKNILISEKDIILGICKEARWST